MATNEESCSLACFRKKFPSDLLVIWQICSAMSANDLINIWEQTVQAAILNLSNFVIFMLLKKTK